MKTERIDKVLAKHGFGTRKEVKKLLHTGLVLVNDNVITSQDFKIDLENDSLVVDNEKINLRTNLYIMMNKLYHYHNIKIFFKTFGYVLSKKDVNKKGTVSNEFYGDYLLRTNQISKQTYDEKIEIAEHITKVVMGKNKNKEDKKKINIFVEEEDFDLEHKMID